MEAVLDAEIVARRQRSETTVDAHVVDVVARQIRAGTYQPRADEVAEQLVAWLFLGAARRTG